MYVHAVLLGKILFHSFVFDCSFVIRFVSLEIFVRNDRDFVRHNWQIFGMQFVWSVSFSIDVLLDLQFI